ncbi:MAG TPA: VOC family protein [Rhizomicrobium sp.]|jgi:PhnB protein
MAEDRPGGIVPYLTIRDGRAAEASAFYQRAFGAEELGRHLAQDGKRLMHCHLKVNDGHLFFSDDFQEFRDDLPAPEPTGTTLHLEVDDADAWWKRAVDAGCQITMPLEDQFWGDRYGRLCDPFGHSWSISSPIPKVESAQTAA